VVRAMCEECGSADEDAISGADLTSWMMDEEVRSDAGWKLTVDEVLCPTCAPGPPALREFDLTEIQNSIGGALVSLAAEEADRRLEESFGKSDG